MGPLLDFAQLPPVGGKPIFFKDGLEKESEVKGALLYQLPQEVIIFDQNMMQNDPTGVPKNSHQDC